MSTYKRELSDADNFRIEHLAKESANENSLLSDGRGLFLMGFDKGASAILSSTPPIEDYEKMKAENEKLRQDILAMRKTLNEIETRIDKEMERDWTVTASGYTVNEFHDISHLATTILESTKHYQEEQK